ncbi:MAG: GNAT family N-acetyltransferase [Candidatus Hodarchaeales archaeon]|jgi:ribosomal protein S18 acetylase RimI-like enzyme
MSQKTPFFYENSQYIRILTRTREDFDRLARCYNSFKDPESWPEGFGGSRIFTGELIAKEMKEQDLAGHFIAIAPDNPDKIVGVSFVGKSWNSPNAYYVQLLGVDPAYQGQKLGKVLLLRSTQYVTKLNADMISLHTWGGNLKAMPLYKRQGYKWRPNTSVYMENYLPQILNFAYFKEFFSKLSNKSWYDSFSPKIDQEPNNTLEDQMQIYDYTFDGENQSLTTWIDRAIGKICGFHIRTPDSDFMIKAHTSNSRAFVGSEEFTITLTVTNTSKSDIKLDFAVESSTKFEIQPLEQKNSLRIVADGSKTLELRAKFLFDTDELDTKVHTHTLTEYGITFNLTHSDITFPLTVGKIPVKAVKINSYPVNFTSIPNCNINLPLSLQNNVGEEFEVQVEVKNGKKIIFSPSQKIVQLQKYDSLVEFRAEIGSTSSSVDYFEAMIKNARGNLIAKEKIPIIIFNESKSLSYELNQQIFVENKHIRIAIFKRAHPGSNEVFITDKLRKLQIFGLPIVLGYPFDIEGSEFYNITHEHQINQGDTGIWLVSSAKSDLKPGIVVTRKIFLPNDGYTLSVVWEVTNNSGKEYSELGVVNHMYWWPSTISLRNRVLPLKSGLKQLDMTAFPVDLGNDPSLFNEGWQATVYRTGSLGILFDIASIDKITIGRAQPNIDIRIPKLAIGEQFQTKPIFLTFTENWQAVRMKWLEQYKPSVEYEVEYSREPTSLKQIGLRNPDEGDTIARGIFIDHEKGGLEIAIDTLKETTFKGSLDLEFNTIPSNFHVDLPDKKGRSFKQKINLEIPKDNHILGGKLKFDSLTRIFDFPVAMGVFDSSKHVSVRHDDTDKVFIVENGFLTFKGSEDYRGNVFHLSLGQKGENLLHTGSVPFPEVKPFLWYNQFFGGIGTILQPEGMRDLENFNKLSFTYYQATAGKWKGIGFKSSIIDYSPRIKGIQLATEYLTLPNSPFLLVQTHVYNHSQITRKFSLQIEGKLKTSETSDDVFYLEDKRSHQNYLKYKLQNWESTVWLEKDPQPKWTAYKRKDSNFYMAAVQPTTNMNEYIYPYTPNLKIIMLDLITNSERILPQQNLTFRLLFFFTIKLEDIAPFTKSNLIDLLPTQQLFPLNELQP